jgi:hypothetical protein
MMGAEHDLDRLVEEVERRRRNDKWQKWGLFVLSMLLMVALTVIGSFLADTGDKLDASNKQVVTEQGEKKEIAKEAQQALCREGGKEIFDKELCEKWATVAEEPPAPLPDAAAATQAELIAAFRAYCAEGDNCRGQDGRPPTADDIAAAFVKFCSTGRCVGKDGEDGKPGKDAAPLAPEYAMVLAAVTEVCSTGVCTGAPGKDGTDGKDGTNATPEMVLAAVQQVCADGACRGEKGDKGEPGQNVTLVDWTDPRTGDKYTCTPNPPGSTTLTCSVEPGTPPILPGVGP